MHERGNPLTIRRRTVGPPIAPALAAAPAAAREPTLQGPLCNGPAPGCEGRAQPRWYRSDADRMTVGLWGGRLSAGTIERGILARATAP